VDKIQKAAILYILIWTISPFMEIDMRWRILALAFTAVWFWCAFMRGIERKNDYSIAIVFAVLVAATVFIENKDFSSILNQISIFVFVIFFIVFGFYEDRWDELSWIFPLLLILLIFLNFKSGYAVLEDPTIARKLVRDDETIYEYLRQGIGGYSLIYPQVVIFPAVFAWVTKAFRQNKVLFIIGIIYVASYVFFVIHAGYSTAIVATLIGIFMLYFYRGNNVAGAYIIAMLIFISFLAIVLYVIPVREFLLEVFDGTAVATKINDLLATSESGAAEGSIEARVIAYTNSFNVIFRHPIIGSLWSESGGGHSALLDILAKYGIFGIYAFAKIIYHTPNYYKEHTSDLYVRAIANATLVSMMIVTTLDSCTYAFSGMMLIVLPMVFENIMKWTGVKHENIVDS